jgi:ATP-dependent DNA helicase RecG
VTRQDELWPDNIKDHSNPITLSAYIPPISDRTEIIEEEYPVLKISVPKSYGGIAATRFGKMLRRRMKSDNTPENIPMYPTEIATRLPDLRLLDYSSMRRSFPLWRHGIRNVR